MKDNNPKLTDLKPGMTSSDALDVSRRHTLTYELILESTSNVAQQQLNQLNHMLESTCFASLTPESKVKDAPMVSQTLMMLTFT